MGGFNFSFKSNNDFIGFINWTGGEYVADLHFCKYIFLTEEEGERLEESMEEDTVIVYSRKYTATDEESNMEAVGILTRDLEERVRMYNEWIAKKFDTSQKQKQ